MRIKTLDDIGMQYRRIRAYLYRKGRRESLYKVDELYRCIVQRILNNLKVIELDAETREWLMVEPLIVGVSY